MNSSLSIVQLKQLKGIMQSMLAEATSANWQELSRLDSERRVLIGYQENIIQPRNTELSGLPKGGKPPAPTKEYAALSTEITALDKEIISTVVNARQTLLDESRVLRAQVSAKKGYENTNTMALSSYS